MMGYFGGSYGFMWLMQLLVFVDLALVGYALWVWIQKNKKM